MERFSSNLGLHEPAPKLIPGVYKLPGWVAKHGFHEQLQPAKTLALTPPPYSMQLDPDSGVRNADAIAVYARQQAVLLEEVLSRPAFLCGVRQCQNGKLT